MTELTLGHVSDGARCALYYMATGIERFRRYRTRPMLERLGSLGLVTPWGKPDEARLSSEGERLAREAGWSYSGTGEQLDILSRLAAAPEEPKEPETLHAAAEPARSPWRWVGGKGALLPSIVAAMPEKFGRLLVPFVGGGALVFAMPGRVAYISDANTHLINAYACMRDRVEDLIVALQDHKNDRDYYDAVVESFNDGYGDDVWRAAAFMYMNKVGYNGVVRYSLKGKYNVPFGDNTKATICDADNLRACSAALRNVEIVAEDFRAVEERAQPSDLIYLDCPYIPESKTAAFTGYWGRWTDQDHEAVPALFRRLAARGVHVLASNSDTPRARELYAGFEIRTLSRANSVNSKASARGGKTEILVLGGTWTPKETT